ncbi:MAG: amidohydrolase family protein [Planctomycetota bacterium]
MQFLPAVFVLVFLLGIVPSFAQEEGPGHLEQVAYVVGGQYFDVETGTLRPNFGIQVKSGRFASLDAKPPEGESNVLRLKENEYLLPGFVDCHAHYNVRLIKKRREEFYFIPVQYLANGATVTFSCGEFDPEKMQNLRLRIERGEQIGPKLLNSGPYFGRARPGWRNKPEEEIRKEVDYWAEQGVGGFKAKAIDPESLRVLIDQAHKHSLTVTGHLDSGYRNSVNPRDAVTMGIDRVEHFLGGDAMPNTQSAYTSLPEIRSGTPAFEKITKHFIANGVFFDCTLSAYGYLGETTPETHEEYEYWIDESQFFTPYMQKITRARAPMKGMEIYQRIYRAKRETIADFHRAGGMISLGTDHVSNGNHLPGFGIHREMDLLSQSGIPNRDVLRIATINGAKALKIEAMHGSIAVGKSADMVVVSGNPLELIRNTRNVQTVIKAGVLYDASQLLDSIRGKLGPSSKEEEGLW